MWQLKKYPRSCFFTPNSHYFFMCLYFLAEHGRCQTVHEWNLQGYLEAHFITPSLRMFTKKNITKKLLRIPPFKVVFKISSAFKTAFKTHSLDFNIYLLSPQDIYLSIYWLAMSNSMYNPVIYCIMNHRYGN